MANAKRIYTIGHSNRTINELLLILKSYNIKTVVDVRRFPKSTKNPQFNKEELEKQLKRHGIKYYWLGEELGGYRKGGYQEYMKTKDYLKGIQKLLELVESGNGNVALMCSEKLWFKCHRKFIADTLVDLGYRVIHIIELDRVQEHRRSPKSR